MARWRVSKDFKLALSEATVEAIQYAARWLADAMRQLVGVQCSYVAGWGMTIPGQRKGHAAEGAPPRREDGDGQASIRSEPTPTGARVGTGMGGFNYMAHWDMPMGIRGHHHPWLSLFFSQRRYQCEFAALVRSYMERKLGAR